MHKILHKLIRYRHGDINVIADVNAAITTGERDGATSSATSYSHIVQRNGRTQTESGADAPTKEEVEDDQGNE